MTTFTHTDRDGDILAIGGGTYGAIVTAEDHVDGHSVTVAVRTEDAVKVARALIAAAGFCPRCNRHRDDEDYGRDEDCDTCFIDGAPKHQWQVTMPDGI